MRTKLRALPYVIFFLPFDILVAAALLAAQVVGVLRPSPAASRRPLPEGEASTSPAGEVGSVSGCGPGEGFRTCTIIIVNWDGKHLLEECLPPVLEAVRFDGGSHQVLVVDNGSVDGSAEFVRKQFPQVRVLALERNYGFTGGNNRGVRDAQTDIVVFLNNDMVVDRAFLKPLLSGFQDPSVFAVTSQIFFSDTTRRREETGKTRARFSRGFFELWHGDIDSREEGIETIPVFWAGGGSCALDRNKYLAIGGLDPLYHPFYVEDTDLSYQAWKRGWKCLLAPASRVVHKHRGTIRPRFGHQFVENTIRKNQFLFIWKNVTDPLMLLEHVKNLPRIHGRAIIQHGAAFEMKAFFRALRQLPEALWKRLSNLPQYVITDHEVLERSQKA